MQLTHVGKTCVEGGGGGMPIGSCHTGHVSFKLTHVAATLSRLTRVDLSREF